jgi:hypothetical protein
VHMSKESEWLIYIFGLKSLWRKCLDVPTCISTGAWWTPCSSTISILFLAQEEDHVFYYHRKVYNVFLKAYVLFSLKIEKVVWLDINSCHGYFCLM